MDMKFNDSDWVAGYIDTEFGIVELHNIYTREKIYCPLPDGDELEAWAMNILALMRRAYDVGRQEASRRFTVHEGGKGSDRDHGQDANEPSSRDHAQPDSGDLKGEA